MLVAANGAAALPGAGWEGVGAEGLQGGLAGEGVEGLARWLPGGEGAVLAWRLAAGAESSTAARDQV